MASTTPTASAKKKAVRKRGISSGGSWTPEVAKGLVDEHFRRVREHSSRSAVLVKNVMEGYPDLRRRLAAVTSLFESGDVTLAHYHGAIRDWVGKSVSEPGRQAHSAAVKDPVREALQTVCGGRRPPHFVRGFDFSGLTDRQKDELQSWCVENCSPRWATGIGAMEAAESIVREALDNGNIRAGG